MNLVVGVGVGGGERWFLKGIKYLVSRVGNKLNVVGQTKLSAEGVCSLALESSSQHKLKREKERERE